MQDNTWIEMSVKNAVRVNARNMTSDGLIDYGKTVTIEEQGNKVVQERQANHALVLMFSPLKALFR